MTFQVDNRVHNVRCTLHTIFACVTISVNTCEEHIFKFHHHPALKHTDTRYTGYLVSALLFLVIQSINNLLLDH